MRKNSRKASVTKIARRHKKSDERAVGLTPHLAAILNEHTSGYFIFCLDASRNLVVESHTDSYADRVALETSIEKFSRASDKLRNKQAENMVMGFSNSADSEDDDDETVIY